MPCLNCPCDGCSRHYRNARKRIASQPPASSTPTVPESVQAMRDRTFAQLSLAIINGPGDPDTKRMQFAALKRFKALQAGAQALPSPGKHTKDDDEQG